MHRSVCYPSAAEMAVLVTLKRYHYLTVEQVMLATSRTSLRAAQQRLKELLDAGLVAKHDRRSSNVLQPLRAAWSLTGKSKAYLEGAGMVVLPPRQPRPYTLDHCLAINDVLIRAVLLAQEYPAVIELRELFHDRDLRTWQPPLTVVPDGYLEFIVTTETGRERFPILVEVDLGTMDRRRWQEKISRYVPFLLQQLPATFGIDTATVAVFAQENRRVDDLKRWTEQELAQLGAAEQQDLFFFTRLEPGLSSDELFLKPRFQTAGATDLLPLLPV